MKKRYLLLCLLTISLTVACEGGLGVMDSRITDEDREFYADDAKEADFNFWRTVSVINKELDQETVIASAQIAGKLLDLGVLGAIRAEWIEQDPMRVSNILEIESEDGKIYQLAVSKSGHRLYAVKDMESGEYLFAIEE